MNTPNPNMPPAMGHNEAPDYAQRVTEQMRRDYEAVVGSVEAAEAEAEKLLQSPMETDAQATAVGAVVKRHRDLSNRLEAFQKKEKEPYLRGGQAVDGFFFSLIDRVARRNRKDNPGTADKLQGKIDEFMQRKLAEEQERRRREREAAEREAEEKRQREAAALAAAEEARLAAERARKPETKEAKAEIATDAEAAASGAVVETYLAEDKVRETTTAAAVKPADMTRTRGGPESAGVTLTMAREPYAEIIDAEKLDKDKLWPFISLDAKEKALRQYARSTGHTVQMEGASIGHRPKARTR